MTSGMHAMHAWGHRQTQSCSDKWAGHSLRQLLIWSLPAPAP